MSQPIRPREAKASLRDWVQSTTQSLFDSINEDLAHGCPSFWVGYLLRKAGYDGLGPSSAVVLALLNELGQHYRDAGWVVFVDALNLRIEITPPD
jgi:hypothetical protein